MARSPASRITSAPAPEKQERVAPPTEAPPPVADPGATTPVHWGWRLAIFLFLTSFAFLFLYELLSAVMRLFKRWIGG